ncbi:hypothetical protein N1F89_05575 [Aquibium sp. A9E412]|uniref:hypothetical protein n=1 Tax=Aquibium sp. A9E412 TaxID=2976767 RepID=UPI0025B0507A|nr:hypothetical protein [Aquibium sp. A9E412]MDN2565684.1 hypothetical protein [Aquibium sp. A9E412]
MHRRLPSAALAAALILAAAPAAAGPIVEQAEEAERLLEAGEPVAAVEALDRAMEEIWRRAPLVFRKVVPVESASGYGLYVEREDSALAPGEPLKVYVEPIGLAYGRNRVGSLEINADLDLAIENPLGTTLFAQEDFLNLSLPVRYRNREVQFTITVELDGAPAGDYVARFTVRDRHSDKRARFALPFSVAER